MGEHRVDSAARPANRVPGRDTWAARPPWEVTVRFAGALAIALAALSVRSAPAAGPPELPAAFLGVWVGSVVPPGLDAPFPVVLALVGGAQGAVVDRSAYPTVGCGGELVLRGVAADGRRAELAELVDDEDGADGEPCVRAGTVVLEALPDGSLRYAWGSLGLDPPGGTATLARLGDADPAAVWPDGRPTADVGAAPIALAIPRLGVRAYVEPVAMADGGLPLPSHPFLAGWDAASGRLGVPGTVVLVGAYADPGGAPAVFHDLAALVAGDRIEVTGDDRDGYAYRVADVGAYAATALPPDTIAGSAAGQRLALVADAPPFDPAAGRYLRALVVRAERDGGATEATPAAWGT